MEKRIVVTGLGVVSPLGCGIETTWNKLIGGHSGVRKLNEFGLSDLCPVHVAARVPIKDCEDFTINSKNSMFIDFTLHATKAAIKSSGFESFNEIADSERCGVSIGSGGTGSVRDIGLTADVLRDSYKKLSPFFIPKTLTNMAAGQVSIRHNLRGPVHSVATACAAGSHSIGDAYNFIRLGYADVMVAGASDACIDKISISGFARMKALSTFKGTEENDSTNDRVDFEATHSAAASRPFDRTRAGFVIGEGAGVLILEKLSNALKRNAPIYAEICGYGLSGDATHPTTPAADGNGARRCMEIALKDASLSPDDIGYINAHATSTPLGDEAEIRAIRDLFGGTRGQRSSPLYVSSTKGATGHLLGAAGAVEAAFSCMSLHSGGVMPPTLNLREMDPGLVDEEVFSHIPHGKGHLYDGSEGLEYVMSNSFGFGGTNSCLIFRRF